MQNKISAMLMQAKYPAHVTAVIYNTHPGLGLGRHLGLVLEVLLVVLFPLGLDPVDFGLLFGRLGLGLEALEELLVDQRRGGQEAAGARAGAGARRHVGGCAGGVHDADSLCRSVGGDGEGIDYDAWCRGGHHSGGGEDGGGLHLADTSRNYVGTRNNESVLSGLQHYIGTINHCRLAVARTSKRSTENKKKTQDLHVHVVSSR